MFTNLEGKPIEPKTFSTHGHRAVRALGLPVRGLYSTKDSFVSLAMSRDVNPVWLEGQTGVRFETLRQHYGVWMRSEGGNQLRKLGKLAPRLGGQSEVVESLQEKWCEEGDLNPHGFYPTSPSN